MGKIEIAETSGLFCLSNQFRKSFLKTLKSNAQEHKNTFKSGASQVTMSLYPFPALSINLLNCTTATKKFLPLPASSQLLFSLCSPPLPSPHIPTLPCSLPKHPGFSTFYKELW